MSGMLSAIPKTPLHDRLAAEGRLDTADVCEYGTNVIPLKMSREELRDGYIRVMNEIYEPETYFERTEALFLEPSFDIGIKKRRNWLSWPGQYLVELALLRPGDRPVRPADDPRPRGRASAASTAAASGGSSRSTAARASCCSTCSTWPCIIMPISLARRVANPEMQLINSY